MYAPVQSEGQNFASSFAMFGDKVAIGAAGDTSGGANAGLMATLTLTSSDDLGFAAPNVDEVVVSVNKSCEVVFDMSRVLAKGVEQYEIQLAPSASYAHPDAIIVSEDRIGMRIASVS